MTDRTGRTIYAIGDFVTLKNLKRKWKVPNDAKFEIIWIEPRDDTVMQAMYKGKKYMVFAENIEQVFLGKERVQFD